jgi:hypothetical protein
VTPCSLCLYRSHSHKHKDKNDNVAASLVFAQPPEQSWTDRQPEILHVYISLGSCCSGTSSSSPWAVGLLATVSLAYWAVYFTQSCTDVEAVRHRLHHRNGRQRRFPGFEGRRIPSSTDRLPCYLNSTMWPCIAEGHLAVQEDLQGPGSCPACLTCVPLSRSVRRCSDDLP